MDAEMMYRECPFCGGIHHREYIEDLEADLLACREQAAAGRRGTVEEWAGRETVPVPLGIEEIG